jgi:hypothetical protein
MRYLIHRNTTQLPAWLDEGLSGFYSTFEHQPERGRGLVGEAPPGHLLELRLKPFLPLDQMLSQEGSARIMRDSRNVGMFYAQAWALVHYLTLGRPGGKRPQISAYLDGVRRGKPTEQAFRETFGVTLAEMQKEPRQTLRFPVDGEMALYLEGPRFRTWGKRRQYACADAGIGQSVSITPTYSGSGVRSRRYSRVQHGRLSLSPGPGTTS